MKIASPLTSPPSKPDAGAIARARQSGAAAGAANFVLDPAIMQQPGAAHSARPTRISRFPEEAALFAYNRQAQLDAAKVDPKIDEYV